MAWPTISLSSEKALSMNIGTSPRKLYVMVPGGQILFQIE